MVGYSAHKMVAAMGSSLAVLTDVKKVVEMVARAAGWWAVARAEIKVAKMVVTKAGM